MNTEPGCPPRPGYHQDDIFCYLLLLVAGTAEITSLVKVFPKLSVEDHAVADSTNEQRKSTLTAQACLEEGVGTREKDFKMTSWEVSAEFHGGKD